MSQFNQVVVTPEELAASEGTALSVELRVEIIQRWKVGQTISQIQDAMQVKRNQVRRVIDPEYHLPASKRTKGSLAREAGFPGKARMVDPPKVQEKPKKVPRPGYNERANMAEDAKKYDPDATRDDCIHDLRTLQEQNKYRFITRNGYRADGKYSEATWSPIFGTFLQFRRSAGLQPSREQHAHERNIAKHESIDHYERFYMDRVEPIGMMYARAERKRVNTIVVISDNHDKKQDPFVYRVFKDVCEQVQPDVIAYNGDQGDLYEFSRFTIDPRQADISGALRFVRDDIFHPVREVCPDSEIIWNLGNHEWRIQKHLADASPHMLALLADYHNWTWADLFGVKDLEINVNCKWDLKAFNQKDIQKQVQQNYLVLWECFALKHIIDPRMGISGTSGHTHRPETQTFCNLSNRGQRSPHNWTVTGSGCRGNAEYVEGMDQSSQGFAIFHVMPDSGIVVPENVIIQGNFAAVGGSYWHRLPEEF